MALQLFPNASKSITLNDGTTYAYVFIPPSNVTKPTFFLLHGFPSSSFDWRRVFPLLQESGYGIVAPDLLGFGDSDKPENLSTYSLKRAADHFSELISKEQLQNVIGVGHDLGSGLLSYMALAHPSSFAGVVFSSVGYNPPGLFDVDQVNVITQQILGYPTFGYWKFFDEEDAGKALDANSESFLSLFYPEHPDDWKVTMGPLGAAKQWIADGTVTPLPTWLSKEDVQKRAKVFEKGGYTAPLNWYKSIMRNMDKPYAATLTTEESKMIELPSLVIVSEHDYVCVPAFQTQTAEAYLRNHQIKSLDCGHWIPLEKPAEFVSLLDDFAKALPDA